MSLGMGSYKWYVIVHADSTFDTSEVEIHADVVVVHICWGMCLVGLVDASLVRVCTNDFTLTEVVCLSFFPVKGRFFVMTHVCRHQHTSNIVIVKHPLTVVS